MNNAKHTPGPWKVYDRGIGFEVHDSDDCPINDGFRETFSEANARLIAAAPELLSALKECTAALEFFDTAVKGYRHADLVALISKAECDPPEAR